MHPAPVQAHVHVCGDRFPGVTSHVSRPSLQRAHSVCQGRLLTLCIQLKACLRMSCLGQCTSKGLYLAVQPVYELSILHRGGCGATKAVYQGGSGALNVMDRAAQCLSCELSARGGCPVQVGAGAGNAVKSMNDRAAYCLIQAL